MADYKELVKMLRLEVECDRRIYPQGLPSKDILISAAADAIEELEAAVNKLLHITNDLEEELEAAVNKLLHITNDLETEVEHLERERRWTPVEERLPDFEGAILCMRKSYIHPGMRHQEIMYVDEHGFSNADDVYAEAGNVTHWMPLPKPPEEDV